MGNSQQSRICDCEANKGQCYCKTKSKVNTMLSLYMKIYKEDNSEISETEWSDLHYSIVEVIERKGFLAIGKIKPDK